MKIMTQDRLLDNRRLDDIDWLATRYVLGEMTAEESAEFESAMMDSVSLCEAVVEATRLTAGITLACKPVTIAPSLIRIAKNSSIAGEPRRSAITQSIIAGAAIAMTLTILVMATAQYTPRNASTVAIDDAAADTLAMLLRSDSIQDTSSEFDEWSLSEDSISVLVAPEWLLTAVDLDAANNSTNAPNSSPDDES